ncbi:ankyrin repeat protein [Durotheca rogersii]|uniref:ankyrin repeat protein n=1 Tax=Durotheca rogersii TaxID=419775 RepID=UPI0022206E30|nr:ankyrin repeat protein [Durotheca rogersii]KAI5860894.1 ankyrin repeat protein [Durotheca rogersii]
MNSDFDDTRLFNYTEAELISHITSLPSLPDFSNIIPLSSKYLAKGYAKDELEDATESMKFASQLGIRVPHIQRIIQVDDGFYCIMDRIPGTTLDMAWPELGWVASLRLAFQLRRVIRRLRSAASTSSGSLATSKCRSYCLEDSFGLPPRATFHQVNAFLNFWANFVSLRQEIKKTPAEHAICPRPVFSYSCPFVFTHHGLAPRNIILDREGQLWIIDWDCAGFYPKFFEYAGMYNFIPKAWTKFALWRWNLFAWIAGGFYDKESQWLGTIRYIFTRFRPARRFNMKAGGYAAAAGRIDNDS